ncbi:uncharacterized protein [Ptychodera flava]|uniref:uncharacterized protein n=1 Tax=Ptychodera flava TaxID=63121 RepID=UPI003969FC31
MSKEGAEQIMISYNWEHQEEVKEIKDALEERGYRIWIDLHNMKGDINKAMAEGVEKSRVILVCVTEAYKDSYNCNKEVSYADTIRKSIIPLKLEKDVKFDGWIGPVIGSKLWFDFSNFKYFKESINGVDKELRALGVKRYGNAPSSDMDRPLHTLRVDGVCNWLKGLDIDDATITIFRNNCVTGDDLQHITQEELVDDFEVRKFVAKKILRNRDKSLAKASPSVVKPESKSPTAGSAGTSATARTATPTRVSHTVQVKAAEAPAPPRPPKPIATPSTTQRFHGPGHQSLVDNLMEKGLIKQIRVYKAMLAVDRGDFSMNNPYEDRPQSLGYPGCEHQRTAHGRY